MRRLGIMTQPAGHLTTAILKRSWEAVLPFRTNTLLNLHSRQVAGIISPKPQARPLGTTPWLHLKQMPPRPHPPPDSEIEESYLKGSGPGGQKINKTNSAVQLKHIPTGIVIKCQETRSRAQNRKIARQILAVRLDDLDNGDQSRSAIVGVHKVKKRASAAKKSARKYRKLAEEKSKEEVADGTNAETVASAEEPSKQLEDNSITNRHNLGTL